MSSPQLSPDAEASERACDLSGRRYHCLVCGDGLHLYTMADRINHIKVGSSGWLVGCCVHAELGEFVDAVTLPFLFMSISRLQFSMLLPRVAMRKGQQEGEY